MPKLHYWCVMKYQNYIIGVLWNTKITLVVCYEIPKLHYWCFMKYQNYIIGVLWNTKITLLVCYEIPKLHYWCVMKYQHSCPLCLQTWNGVRSYRVLLVEPGYDITPFYLKLRRLPGTLLGKLRARTARCCSQTLEMKYWQCPQKNVYIIQNAAETLQLKGFQLNRVVIKWIRKYSFDFTFTPVWVLEPSSNIGANSDTRKINGGCLEKLVTKYIVYCTYSRTQLYFT